MATRKKAKQLKQYRVRSDVKGGFIISTSIATIAAVRYAWKRFTKDVEVAVTDAVDEVLDNTPLK